MSILFTVIVTFFAGMGAGLGTGFAGMSAAAVISPMLITFLHMIPNGDSPPSKREPSATFPVKTQCRAVRRPPGIALL